MRAVILAAGRGGRLRGAAGDRPKCLARVGARTLLERQMQALRACGVDDIAVVVGYRADDVRARLRIRASTSSSTRAMRRPTASTRSGWRAIWWRAASSC